MAINFKLQNNFQSDIAQLQQTATCISKLFTILISLLKMYKMKTSIIHKRNIKIKLNKMKEMKIRFFFHIFL